MKKFVLFMITAAVLASLFVPVSFAEELYSKVIDMTDVEPDGENGIVHTEEAPNGDYTVTVSTGGDTETKANIYINGGERVRAYTLEAGKTQDNEQPVVVTDGKISVQVLGENPNVTKIEIQELPKREKAKKPTIYIAGDSTAESYKKEKAYPQTGWGQVFADYMTDGVRVENRSIGGRSSKSYNNDGRLDRILTQICPGDYLFIQFGINDGAKEKPERYISVEDYCKLIEEKYINETIKRGGIPVLMTATAASWWDEENNCFMESRADYAEPTRELARKTGVAFIDANRLETDKWNSMEREEVESGYFVCEPLESAAYPAGTNDHTHLKEKGARVVAGIIAGAIPEAVPALGDYVRKADAFNDVKDMWFEEEVNLLSEKFIAKGDGENNFNPDKDITRAEFLKLIMNAAGINGHAYRENECLDAGADEWYNVYLQGALDKDIIPPEMIENCEIEKTVKTLAEATEEKEAVTCEVNVYKGSFNAEKPITREEAAAIIANVIKDFEIKTQNEVKYTDADRFSEWAASYIEDVSNAGIMNGMGDGRFSPDSNITRAQAAVLTVRVMQAEENVNENK